MNKATKETGKKLAKTTLQEAKDIPVAGKLVSAGAWVVDVHVKAAKFVGNIAEEIGEFFMGSEPEPPPYKTFLVGITVGRQLSAYELLTTYLDRTNNYAHGRYYVSLALRDVLKISQPVPKGLSDDDRLKIAAQYKPPSMMAIMWAVEYFRDVPRSVWEKPEDYSNKDWSKILAANISAYMGDRLENARAESGMSAKSLDGIKGRMSGNHGPEAAEIIAKKGKLPTGKAETVKPVAPGLTAGTTAVVAPFNIWQTPLMQSVLQDWSAKNV